MSKKKIKPKDQVSEALDEIQNQLLAKRVNKYLTSIKNLIDHSKEMDKINGNHDFLRCLHLLLTKIPFDTKTFDRAVDATYQLKDGIKQDENVNNLKNNLKELNAICCNDINDKHALFVEFTRPSSFGTNFLKQKIGRETRSAVSNLLKEEFKFCSYVTKLKEKNKKSQGQALS